MLAAAVSFAVDIWRSMGNVYRSYMEDFTFVDEEPPPVLVECSTCLEYFVRWASSLLPPILLSLRHKPLPTGYSRRVYLPAALLRAHQLRGSEARSAEAVDRRVQGEVGGEPGSGPHPLPQTGLLRLHRARPHPSEHCGACLQMTCYLCKRATHSRGIPLFRRREPPPNSSPCKTVWLAAVSSLRSSHLSHLGVQSHDVSFIVKAYLDDC